MTWTLHAIAGLIMSFASMWVLIGIAATAVAVLEPSFLDRITDLRKWAIVTAVLAFSCTGLITYGYKNGLDEKQTEWDSALARETVSGEKIRSDADLAVPDTSDRRVFDDDSNNRDRGQQPAKPVSPLRRLAPHHLFGRD